MDDQIDGIAIKRTKRRGRQTRRWRDDITAVYLYDKDTTKN